MKNAKYHEKDLVIDILAKSFEENKSVNYIIKQDAKRSDRIRALMAYSFEVCSLFGEVFLSDDNRACALIVYPDKKKVTLKSISLDVKLIFQCIGIRNFIKTLKREKLINSVHPQTPFSYLWFIGVAPEDQNEGIGSKLLKSVLDYNDKQNRPVYLETSTVRNLPWYDTFGFQSYHEEELTYHLYFYRRAVKK